MVHRMAWTIKEMKPFIKSSLQVTSRPFIKYSIIAFSIILSFGPTISPYLNGIGEVCCPILWRKYLFGGAFLLTGLGIATLVIYTIVFVISALRGRFNFRRPRSVLLLLLLLLFWVSTYAITSSYFSRWVSAYPLGAHLRLLWVGGSVIIKQDAIQLLETSTEVNPAYESLPQSIRELGVTNVELDTKFETIRIDLTSSAIFASRQQFGFIVQNASDDSIILYEHFLPNSYRIWELEKGLYFFQTDA